MAKKKTPTDKPPRVRQPEPKQANPKKPTGKAYTYDEVEKMFSHVIQAIEVQGLPLRKTLRIMQVSSRTFFEWLNDDTPEVDFDNAKLITEVTVGGDTYLKGFEGGTPTTRGTRRQKRYARACEEREHIIFEEIIDIADDATNDTYIYKTDSGVEIEKTNIEVIQRSKQRIEARMWVLGKMRPEKYGNNVQQTIKGDATAPLIINLGSGINPEEDN